MDDRFRNEGADEFNNGTNSDYPVKTPALGDFSVNIDTKKDVAPSAPKAKKFEVHIPDTEQEIVPKDVQTPGQQRVAAPQNAQGRTPTQRPAAPSRPAGQPPYGQRRPASPSSPNGRPVPPAGYQPAQRRSGNSLAAAAGRTAYSQRAAAQGQGRTIQGQPPRAPLSPEARAEQQRRAAANAKKSKKALKAKKKAARKRAVSENERKRRSMRRYTFVKGLLITCVCMIFISIISLTASTIALSVINDILVIDSDSEYSVTVEVPEGADYSQVFSLLVDKGLVKQPFLTDFFCRFRDYDTVEYLPGTYFLESDVGVEKLLESMMANNDYAKDTIRLTFPEGWTVAEIFEKIEKYEVCEAEKLYANLSLVGEQYGFISDITSLDGRYLKAEGYLFPDTYDFYIGENASSVVDKLFANFNSRWTSEYNARVEELGMTIDEIIIIASIIQAEAKDGSQMADISSVIHNRLNDSATYPTIDMNSTKDYITALKDYGLFTDVYYSLYLDKYNTYSQTGLPPGPICNPGETAIAAALYPNDTKYYFFCHDADGEIYLAETVDEHNENTSKVLYGDIAG